MAIANDPAALWAVIVRCQCKKGQTGMENVVTNIVHSYILYMHIDVHYILILYMYIQYMSGSIIHNLQDTSLLLRVGDAFLRIHLLLGIFPWDPLSHCHLLRTCLLCCLSGMDGRNGQLDARKIT